MRLPAIKICKCIKIIRFLVQHSELLTLSQMWIASLSCDVEELKHLSGVI